MNELINLWSISKCIYWPVINSSVKSLSIHSGCFLESDANVFASVKVVIFVFWPCVIVKLTDV